MIENPLANIGDLTKPATVLIEKISEAVGGIFRPYQLVRVAKAEAEAQRALPLLKDDASPGNVANDWITNFFDKSRIVSNVEMQELWSRVLAGEANAPGTFSRRTVNLLADLDKGDAELFMKLCGFGWMIGNVVPLIFDVEAAIYNEQGIHFNSLIHLESLSLIQFDNIGGYLRRRLPKRVRVFFYGRPVELTLPNDTINELDIGHVLLTKAGQELAPICGATPVETFFDFVYDRWAANGLVAKKEAEQNSPAAG